MSTSITLLMAPSTLEAIMAARDYGDMPLGGTPNLPQYRAPKADISARAKAQNFAFGAGGAVRVERFEDTEGKLDDPRAHVSGDGCELAVFRAGGGSGGCGRAPRASRLPPCRLRRGIAWLDPPATRAARRSSTGQTPCVP